MVVRSFGAAPGNQRTRRNGPEVKTYCGVLIHVAVTCDPLVQWQEVARSLSW